MRIQGSIDGGLSWFVVFASFMNQFVVLGIHNVFGLLYINLLEEFGESRAVTAWVASISFGLTFVFAPLSSAMCKKFGCRVITIIGGVLCGLGLLLSSLVTSIFHMYVTYSLLFGLGGSMCHCSAVLVLTNYFSKYLVVANGIGLSGAGVGTITLAPALSLLLDSYYWRDALRILSATSLIFVISGFIFFLVRAPMESFDTKELEFEERKLIDFSVLKNKALVLWISVIGLIQFGFYIPYVHLVSHGQDLGIPKQDGAVLIGYMAMSQTVGKIVFGRVADHPRVDQINLCQICLLVCSVLTTLLPAFRSYDSLLAYSLLLGFHDGCFQVLVCVFTMEIAGKKKMVSALGIMYFFMGISLMLGPPVAGWMYSLTNRYEPAFYMAGAFTTLGVCLLFLIPRLLPAEIIEELRMRSKSSPASSASDTTKKSCTLDSGSCCSESESNSVVFDTRKEPSVLLDKHVLDTSLTKRQSTGSGVDFILERYFSVPTLACEQGYSVGYSFSDVRKQLSDIRRETWV